VRFLDAGTGRIEVLGRAASVSAMLDAVARRLEGGRPGSRFPLLQLLRREGAVSAPECGALAFEVARLQSMLGALPCAGDEPPEARDAPSTLGRGGLGSDGIGSDGIPRGASSSPPRTVAEAFSRPLRVLAHFARLGAASGDGLRLEATEPSPAPPPLPEGAVS
jgi:hypothetical protein